MRVVLVSSLLTLNYFTPFPSFPIVYFEQVNIYWKNYLPSCSSDICLNVSTVGMQNLRRSNAGNSVFFFYFTHSVSCNLGKSSINQILHSRDTRKFVKMRPVNSEDTKIKQEIAVNRYLRSFSILEDHKLHRIKDLQKALNKISYFK